MHVVNRPHQANRKRSDAEWMAAFRDQGADHDRALTDLRNELLRAMLVYLKRHRNSVKHLDRDEIRRLVDNCAEQTLLTIEEQLPTFQGHSRFKTWAYGLAIKHAARELRQHARPAATSN